MALESRYHARSGRDQRMSALRRDDALPDARSDRSHPGNWTDIDPKHPRVGLPRMRLLGRGGKRRRQSLASAERQQHFLPERVIEVLELERGLALVAEHLDHGRTPLFVDF